MLIDYFLKIKTLFLVEIFATIFIVTFIYSISLDEIHFTQYGLFLTCFGSALTWLLFSRYGNYVLYYLSTKEGINISGVERENIEKKTKALHRVKPLIGSFKVPILMGLWVGSIGYILCRIKPEWWLIWTLLVWTSYLIFFSRIYTSLIYLQSNEYLSQQSCLFHGLPGNSVWDLLLPEIIFKLVIQAFIYYEISLKPNINYSSDALFIELFITIFLVELVTGFFIATDIKKNADIALSAKAVFINRSQPDTNAPAFSEEMLTLREFFTYLGLVVFLPLTFFCVAFYLRLPIKLPHYLLLCLINNQVVFCILRKGYLTKKWIIIRQTFMPKTV